jgi:hypothetical protein
MGVPQISCPSWRLEVILGLAALVKIDERKKSTLPLLTFVKVRFFSPNFKTG